MSNVVDESNLSLRLSRRANSGQQKYYKNIEIYQLTPPEIEGLANEISAFSRGKITVVSADNKYVKIPRAQYGDHPTFLILASKRYIYTLL